MTTQPAQSIQTTSEIPSPPPMSYDAPAPPARPGPGRRLLLDTAYALSAFFVALPAFVLVVVLLSAGLGLVLVVGGVLLLTLATQVARGVAHLERHRLRTLQRRPAPAPVHLAPPPSAGFWRRMLTPLRDPQSWLDVAWSLVGLVTGTLAFAVTIAWWAVALGGLTYWAWQGFLPDSDDDQGLAELLGLGEGRLAESLLQLVLGVVALLTLPLVVRLAALVHAGTAALLLCGRAELQSQVRRVEGGRDAARKAEAQALRRLERDIHDGPQQRLVRLGMDLARARRQLERDPDRVPEILDGALVQAREAVEELRSLSRGIAPPLLVDRGLAAALAELVELSGVPVAAEVRLPGDLALAPHVETAVYFVCAEALTNVNKHSGAARARLLVHADDEAVEVLVHDDGTGGAHVSKGLGLAGLQQRLAGVDGELAVRSPVGGPTEVRARVPRGRPAAGEAGP